MGSKLSPADDGSYENKHRLVMCFGEMLIAFVPPVAGVSLAEAPAFEKAPGGAPANVAVGIARLGGSSAFVGKVGDDEFGLMLSNMLKENNVDNSGVRFDHGARTALAFVTNRTDGEREFLFFRHPSADMLFHESELDERLIEQDGILMQPVKNGAVVLNAALANENKQNGGGILANNPNHRPPVEGEEKVRKKGHFLGKGKSAGTFHGHGSSGPGWTGTGFGFDIDGRS